MWTINTVAIAVSVSLAPPADVAADPFAGDPPTSAPAPADMATTSVAPQPTSTPARPALPGFPPEVDVNDEATWTELSAEQKDQLRAIRAEQRYQAAQAGQAPAPYVSSQSVARRRSAESQEIAELRAEHRRFVSRAESRWVEQDGRLVVATAVTGSLWAIGVAATAGMAVTIGKKTNACTDDIASGAYDSAANCSARNASAVQRLSIGTYVVGSMTGALAVGFLVSGILLGVHRSNRPEWAVARGRARLAVTRSGLRLKF